MFEREELAGAADAGQHLVGDEQHAVAIADFADARVVARRRHGGAGRRAADRLGDERGDVLRPGFEDRGFQSVAGHGGIVVAGRPIRIRRVDHHHVDQPWRVHRAVVRPRRGRKREQCVAVIARGARDDDRAIGLAALHVVLPRKFERSLDGFRTAGQEIRAVDAGRRFGRQRVGELFDGRRRERGAVDVGDRCCLLRDRVGDLAHAMADRCDHRAAARVEVLLAAGIVQIDAFGAHDGRRRDAELSIEDVAHRAERLRRRGGRLPAARRAASLRCMRQ